MTHLAVFRCRVGSHEVMAWCTVGSGAGFDTIEYTELDGYSPAAIDAAPELSDFLFVVPVEVPSKRETFPASPAPPAASELIGRLGIPDWPATMGIPAGDAD